VEPPATPPDEPPRRSSFEDFEIPVPAAIPRGRRPAVITTATVVLAVAGLMNVLYVLLFGGSASQAVLFLLLGAAQLVTAALLVVMAPIGRTAALAVGGIGILLGFVQAIQAPTSGLMSMALNGFVVWAAFAGGPAFRRG
jgi:hypothetical protein